jgi:hypothetical protein
MNKKFFIGSLLLNVVLIIWLIIVLVADEPVAVDLSVYTQQDLSKAFEIKPGMSASELKKLMGVPAIREFDDKKDEWHYCKTGSSVDEYVVVELSNDKVVSLNRYVVSWLDMVFHYTQTPTEALIEAGGLGDCKLTAKWGTYGQDTPNKSINFAPSAPDS